ncbi:MAG: hypothetical protein ETSY2_41470 [Candidatus Entotheonella gemina]|uniref:pPIWI-RE RNaseH domain-containing protein n=1 Tax=Candidatus Entotheonella gemina TaxID=1429439 RepID=W4LM04_9BACT|nr:MAG: hypothetical protein ETSY2_41470 [Candidatus Entotheonella gemina]
MGFLQEGDDPDHVAAFVDHLRYGFEHHGDWTSLPAPLFFIRVVKDYLAEFTEEEAIETLEEDDNIVFVEAEDMTEEAEEDEDWLSYRIR